MTDSVDNLEGGLHELEILKEAVENTNEGFVTIDQDHRVLFFNRAAEKIFGYDRKEVLGRDLEIILTPRCSTDHRRAVGRYLKERTPRSLGHERELIAVRKNGETFPASISFSVASIGGRLIFTGVVRDLTEAKALEEQVSAARRMAAVGQLVAEIAHEIKNPLMLIGGFARQLIRGAKEEKLVSKLKIIADEVHRLETLLEELKNLYRPKTLALEKLEIHGLVAEVCRLVEEDCRQKEITIITPKESTPIWVQADRAKLKQVLLNLMKNGVEALGRGGNLTIGTRLSAGRLHITIKDDGPGIPKEIKPKLFTPFVTTKSRGCGLGLAVCKRIIEDHPGGSLTLTSEEGKGTEAKISIPCDAAGAS